MVNSLAAENAAGRPACEGGEQDAEDAVGPRAIVGELEDVALDADGDAGRRLQLAQLDELFSPRLATQDAQGLVRLAAPAALRPILSPLLLEFAALHPQIRLDVRLSDQHSDVVDEQIDLGIRAGLLRDQSFVALQISQVALYLVASPAYLAAHGTPSDLAALNNHQQVSLLDEGTGRPWAWFFRDGEIYQPRQVRLLVNDAQQELAAVAAGLGIGQIADFLAQPRWCGCDRPLCDKAFARSSRG